MQQGLDPPREPDGAAGRRLRQAVTAAQQVRQALLVVSIVEAVGRRPAVVAEDARVVERAVNRAPLAPDNGGIMPLNYDKRTGQQHGSLARRMIHSVWEAVNGAGKVVRAEEWWGNKLCPVLAVAYGTAFQCDLALSELAPVLVFLLASLVLVGSYANLLNDLCDLRQDELCGKRNRLAGRSAYFRMSALVIVILLGVLAGWVLWPSRTLITVYLAMWLVFTLYSLPPVRLKVRGFLGVLADAAGAHPLPQLFGMYLIAAWGRGTAPAPAWVVAVAVWSLARGVRGILWHQLSDFASDQRAGVDTFVQRHSQGFVRLLGERLLFPVELAGLGAMLVLSGTVLGWVFLAVHLMLEFARCRLWSASVIVVMPRERFRFALDEYYVLFYPLTFLLAASWRNPLDLMVLAVHMLLFPAPAKYLARDLYGLVRIALGRGREWAWPRKGGCGGRRRHARPTAS